jgi:hypothetical protein
MAVFRLMPIALHRSDPSWRATKLQVGCWVRARSKEHARIKVELITGLDEGEPNSPWRNPQLTTCVVDGRPPADLPASVVLDENGHTHS